MDGRRIRVKKKLFRLKNIGIRMDVALARHSSFHETEIIQSSVSVITSGGSRGARPRPPPPPYFLTKLRPQGPKFFFLEVGPLPPPLSQGHEDRASPLSEGLVWIYRALHDLRLLLLIFSFSVYYCLVKLFITLCPCLCLLLLLMGL